MLNVGTPELLVIAVLALLVLGPTKLPEAMRKVGQAVGELRRMSSGFQSELRDALQEPVDTAPKKLPQRTPEDGGAGATGEEQAPGAAAGDGTGNAPPNGSGNGTGP